MGFKKIGECCRLAGQRPETVTNNLPCKKICLFLGVVGPFGALMGVRRVRDVWRDLCG